MLILTYFFIFIFGASIGSFLNVLIDRLPQEKSITGRSYCDYCHHKLSWYDLIPIVSFFILRGKCRYCHKKISWFYPVVELITGLLFISIFNLQFTILNKFSIPQLLNFLITLTLISCLIVIFFSDLKYHLISDYILLAFFIFSFLYNFSVRLTYHNLFVTLNLTKSDVLSALIVGFPIFLIYYLSHEKAMGLGDVYLAAIMGFLLGWKAGFIALYIAFITGAIFGLVLIILKEKKLKSKIAFGPFLVVGTILMLFYGKEILNLIQMIYGF